MMKEPNKPNVGAAAPFEHLADDGWPEDAGWWPERIGGCALHSVNCSNERRQGVRGLSLSHFIRFLLRSPHSSVVVVPWRSSTDKTHSAGVGE